MQDDIVEYSIPIGYYIINLTIVCQNVHGLIVGEMN